MLATVWCTMPALPERMPVHVDLAGRPNRWATPPRAAGELTVEIFATLALFGLATLLVDRCPPRGINRPRRDAEIIPPHRAAALRVLHRWIAREAPAITAVFGWLWAVLVWAQRPMPVRRSTGARLAGMDLWPAVLVAEIVGLCRHFARPPPAAPSSG